MITDKERASLDKFKALLESSFKENFFQVKLFGSKARGDDRKESDIDVLVLMREGDWRSYDRIYELVVDILLEEEVSLSAKVMTDKEYNNLSARGNAFINNINREGITL